MSTWRKSSYSFSNGNCAEVAAWRRSARCNGGACVEVGQGQAVVAVRDTRDREAGPVLTFDAGDWRAFTERLKREAVGH